MFLLGELLKSSVQATVVADKWPVLCASLGGARRMGGGPCHRRSLRSASRPEAKGVGRERGGGEGGMMPRFPAVCAWREEGFLRVGMEGTRAALWGPGTAPAGRQPRDLGA